MSTTASPAPFPIPSRGWLIFGGIISLIAGFVAIACPLVFTVVLEQILGIVLLANGAVALFLVIFGQDAPHRFWNVLSALLRFSTGLILLTYAKPGEMALTLILAVFFVMEGIFCLAYGWRLRSRSGIWIALNGLVALLLGGMVYAKWPSDAAWVLGLLYGINSIFGGFAILMLGLATPKSPGKAG